MVMMKDEALMVSSFFCGKGGGECSSKEIAPLKNFQKKFFGSGCGVVLNGWGELVIRDLWSVRFLATIHLKVKTFRSYKCKFQTPTTIIFFIIFFVDAKIRTYPSGWADGSVQRTTASAS